MTMLNQLELRGYCRHCGRKGSEHRGSDGLCPGKGPEPKWPRTIRDEAKAGALFDKRMAKYWSKQTTTFEVAR